MNQSPQGGLPGTRWYDSALFVTWALIGLGCIFAWRGFLTNWVNLIPDECSYWAWSRHLDWSYFDNSGMVAYLIRLSTTLFGEQTPFAVRFPFLVFSALGTYLVYQVSADLFERRSRALLATLALNLTPIMLLGASAAMHDNALTFFWIAALWGAVRFIKTEKPCWFYFIGVTAGLSIQSKYTGVLILPSFLLFLLWSKAHRGWLRRREPWIGALLAGLFAVPIVLWNLGHEWAPVHHILFIGSGSDSLLRRILDGLGYHVAQFLAVSPLFYCALLSSLVWSVARNLTRPRPQEILLLCFSLPLFLFGVMAFIGHVEANWAFMGYAPAAILAVEFITGDRTDESRRPWKWFDRRFFKWGVIFALGMALLVVLHGWIGLLPASIERKLGKADRVIWETRGWAGLGKHVGKLRQEGDVIAADSYQLCALLEFNVPGNPKVRYVAPWKRPTQFDVWEPSYDNLKGRQVLFVSPRPLEPTSSLLTTIYDNFSRVERLPAYEVIYHGSVIRRMYVCRGYDFNPFSPRRLGPRSLFYKDY
jgi:4-amino-4-deoxy-L-arabinose transferase-like glycosyltransferase